MTTKPERNSITPLDLQEYEDRLNSERQKIVSAIEKNHQATADIDEGWQELDSPSEIEIREVEYSHREALQSSLKAVDEALDRMHHQRFGLCIDCGKQIGVKRLYNDATVSRCLNCQSELDSDLHIPTL